jgi:hypothetical protein
VLRALLDLSDDEIAALTSHLSFTEEGLLWDLSTGVTDRTDTTVADEAPNITADTITITAGDAVGDAQSQVKLINVTDGDIAAITDDADNTTKIQLLSADPEDIEFFM